MPTLRKVIFAICLTGLATSGGYLHAQVAAPQGAGQRAGEIIDGMMDAQRRVDELKEKAKREKDTIRLDCLNAKLLSIKGYLKVAETTRGDLNNGGSGTGSDEQSRYMKRLELAESRVTKAREEAEACVGEDATFGGGASVQVDEPDNIDDPTQDEPFSDFGDVEPPAYASPFV